MGIHTYRGVWAPGQHLLGSKAHHKSHVFHIDYRSRKVQSGSRCSFSLTLYKKKLTRRSLRLRERENCGHPLSNASVTNASVSGLLTILFYSLHTGRCHLWIPSRDLGVRISTRSLEICLQQYDRLLAVWSIDRQD